MSPEGSIPFDRAAEHYDRTRRFTAEASEATVGVLRDELDGRQPCLEIGVGTGLIALPLHASGIRMTGIDLSRPMLGKLIEKGGGRSPLPLVVGDATQLPLVDDAFGGAIARHVLQLIPNWLGALAELVRVVRPGGVILINAGTDQGPWRDVRDHLDAQVGEVPGRVDLDQRSADVDASMTERGWRNRELPIIWQESELTLAKYFEEVEACVFSWTWILKPERLATALAETKVWATEHFGDFDRILEPRFPSIWRAYERN